MTIVETTVWIDSLKGASNAHTHWLSSHLTDANLALTDLILCEVLQGIRDDAVFVQIRKELLKFGVLSSGGQEMALASAQNYRYLRARGITVRKTVDCMIATFCIRGGHSLLHRDRDYEPFEKYLGLKVIHP
jgi:predicted nucleic acid-binding protein